MAALGINQLNSGTPKEDPGDASLFPGWLTGFTNGLLMNFRSFLFMLGRERRVERTTSGAVVLAAPTHHCHTICLMAAGATVDFANMATVHDGFTFVIWNMTGTDLTFPSVPGGVTIDVLSATGHTKFKNNDQAVCTISALSTGRRLVIQGGTTT